MFGFVKKWLGKKGQPTGGAPALSSTHTHTHSPSAAADAARAAANARGHGGSAPAVAARPPASVAAVSVAEPSPGDTASDENSVTDSGEIRVSLLGVVDLLPAQLKPIKAVGDVASVQISIPLRLVLGQLAQGCARIPFGELRRLAPTGFFTASSEHDAKPVDLPLREVLPQLSQGTYSRRSHQQATYVPEEVTNVFAARGTSIASTHKPQTNAVSAPASKPTAAPGKTGGPSATPVAARPGSAATASGPTSQFKKPPLPAPHLPPEPAGRAAKPADLARSSTSRGTAIVQKPSAPASPSAKGPAIPGSGLTPPAPRPASPPAAPAAPQQKAKTAGAEAPPGAPSKPIAAPSLLAAMQGGDSTPQKSGPAARKPGSPQTSSPGPASSAPAASMRMKPGETAPAASQSDSASGDSTLSTQVDDKAVFAVPLAQVSSGWPGDVTAEIASWGVGDSALMLLVSEVNLAMRRGRVQYPWGEILSRLSPAAPPGAQSSHADVALDLPLQVIAPLFLAARQSASGQERARSKFDASIPDMFQGGAPAAPSVPAPAASTASAQKPHAATGAVAPAAAQARVPSATKASAQSSPAQGFVAKVSVQAPPVPAPADPEPSEASGELLSIPLAMIDESWSDALKSQIAHAQIAGLKLNLPYEEANKGLKNGKLEYNWKQLCEWMHPALPEGLGADHADKMLTLPLKVVAPMFLGQFKPGRATRKAQVNEEIPDLFSGGGASAIDSSNHGTPAPAVAESSPETQKHGAAHPPAAPAEPLGASSYSTTQFFRKPPADLGELFGQPGKRNWTPQEVVQSTTRVRGVAGAVIAMQDGLLVAAQLQSPWRPEATAAFLPQIYSRMNQYLKELEAGDLDSVTLNTPSGTLFVFTAGIIYFAIVSKVGEEVSLPAIQLIVKELSRHSK
ncbi:MAG: roadblock/LC7 domain-containing protein [Verrucomicrobia bacterium]|nr:roadblock/LC7 domain-containing protein [Verrucomicrobiota bacterium]MBI3871316.1 roadblock/LC7 domain-containing protein [Verrucomicrobiota bacterium]